MKTCLYCGRKRKLNASYACRECNEKQNVSAYTHAVKVLMDGTGEEEDEAAEMMWDILDGKTAKPPRRTPGL